MGVENADSRGSGREGAGSLGTAWAGIRGRVTWLRVLTTGAAAVVALELIHPAAYHLPSLDAATASLITMLALVAAVLFGTQFSHTRRLRDLTLFGALVMFTVVEVTSSALPAVLETQSGGRSGAALLGLLFVAAAISAAAQTPSSKLVNWGRRPAAIVIGLSLLVFAAAELGGLLLISEPNVVARHPLPGISLASGHPLGLIVVLLTAGLLAFAGAGLAHRADAEQDGALSLLSGAAVLMTAACLCFFASPWLSPQWMTSRDGLCLLAFVLIVAAGARQEHAVRARLVREAAVAERLRVTRDLHDGLAQDLAVIAAHGARMAEELGVEHPVTVAARRAVSASRGTITDLSASHSRTPRDALEAIAHELGDRFPTAIEVDADVNADLTDDSREQLLRIAREAIANACRHGGAKNVLVSMRQTRDGVAMRVSDDGCGIRGAGEAAGPEGFGIRSMRERAATLDGQLTVHQRRSGGTELQVMIP